MIESTGINISLITGYFPLACFLLIKFSTENKSWIARREVSVKLPFFSRRKNSFPSEIWMIFCSSLHFRFWSGRRFRVKRFEADPRHSGRKLNFFFKDINFWGNFYFTCWHFHFVCHFRATNEFMGQKFNRNWMETSTFFIKVSRLIAHWSLLTRNANYFSFHNRQLFFSLMRTSRNNLCCLIRFPAAMLRDARYPWHFDRCIFCRCTSSYAADD